MSTLFSAEAPPYVVVGTAKFSFLARIELSFNGIGEAESPISDAQQIVVEHWVEVWDVDLLSDFHLVGSVRSAQDCDTCFGGRADYRHRTGQANRNRSRTDLSDPDKGLLGR